MCVFIVGLCARSCVCFFPSSCRRFGLWDAVMVMAMAATAAAREAEGKKEDRAAQVASHQTRFQKIVLSWDYPRLLARSKVRSVIYCGEFAHFMKGVVG